MPWLLADKLGLYISSLVAAGLSAHVALGILELDARLHALRAAAFCAIAAAVFGTLRFLIVSAQLGGGLSGALEPTTLRWAMRVLGSASTALIVGSGVVLAGWAFRNSKIAAVGVAGLAASFALTGHSQGLETPGLAPLEVGVHVLIAMFWIAAPLTLWPRRDLPDALVLARLTRFSAIAIWVIPVLFLLGVWLAWLLAGGGRGLLNSGYGWLVIAKFIVGLLALAMGALNKVWTTQAIAAGRPAGRNHLKIALTVEGAAFLAALVLITLATSVFGPDEAR